MENKNNSQWIAFDGLNVNYLLDQYEVYLNAPDQVDSSLIPIFQVWDGLDGVEANNHTAFTTAHMSNSLSEDDKVNLSQKTINIFKYIQKIRQDGHLQADIYPLEKRDNHEAFTLENFNLTEQDLEMLPASIVKANRKETSLKTLVEEFKKQYISNIGIDVAHLPEDERQWFYDLIESDFIKNEIESLNRDKIIEQVFRAEVLEQYLQKYYMGQKRFSGEGLETLMPVMNRLVELAANERIDDVFISMAHRGRLNALVHVLDQPYEWLLSKFEGIYYDTGEVSEYDKYNSTGDVKYHLGAKTTRHYGDNDINITMANNPSHLEFVNSVIQGMTRAKQDNRKKSGYSEPDSNKAIPILVHGDAAMAGQGVNYETFNLSNLNAYSTGGSIHIIANNTIGFTTYNEEQLSTKYASDPFKGFDVPVIHMNADKPEDAVAATKLAFLYRQTFHKDIIINLIGYRRLGHNELDEPRMTNPLMYQKIDALDTVSIVYGKYLLENQFKNDSDLEKIKNDIESELDIAKNNVKESAKEAPATKSLSELIESKIVEMPEVDTTVDLETLERLNTELITWNSEFNVIKNLQRSLERRKDIFSVTQKIDWSVAEALAFATILEEGTPIRISGEDCERGTFSHRSMVMKDTKTGDNFTPMHHISNANVSFDIYNSSLTEMAVAGFEYGYSMTAKEALVFWEAQFGDFANGAQIIIDQFISGGRKKWGELSGLVMLLPHGYEGAGPEHSSARLERYLQLAAENNMSVVNLSTAAQLFHILRRQAKALNTEAIRPLIIMTPKSLLRSEDAASPVEDFIQGKFEKVLDDKRENLQSDKVTRILMATGRINVDIYKALEESENEQIAHIRLEEIYPFPEKEIKELLAKYKNAKEIVWVQEEPKNMGAYAHVHLNMLDLMKKNMTFKYIGRPAMAAPSEGLPAVHKKEQARIVSEALDITK